MCPLRKMGCQLIGKGKRKNEQKHKIYRRQLNRDNKAHIVIMLHTRQQGSFLKNEDVIGAQERIGNTITKEFFFFFFGPSTIKNRSC